MVTPPALANLIREDKTFRLHSAIKTGRKYGMQLLDDALFNLWKTGICEEHDVVIKANRVSELQAKIDAAKRGVLEEDEFEDDEEFE